jgi:hypothetical protein
MPLCGNWRDRGLVPDLNPDLKSRVLRQARPEANCRLPPLISNEFGRSRIRSIGSGLAQTVRKIV